MSNNPENVNEQDNLNPDSEENTQTEITDAEANTEDLSAAETVEFSANETAVSEEDAGSTAEEAETPAAPAATESFPAEEKLETEKAKTATAPASEGLGTASKFLILIGVLIALGAGLVYWKTAVGSHHVVVENISKEEMEMILKDANPMMLRQLAQDPAAKKELAENVKELFAVASQAQKEGMTADIDVKRELENIETEILATNYDKAINKDKGSMPPFGFISEERMSQFWEATDTEKGFLDKIGLGSNNAKSREAAFQKFLDSKLKMVKESNPAMKDRELSEEEMKQAKEYFAKTRIYAAEAEAKRGVPNNGLPEDFFQKVDLQTKLQKAQFLARVYSQKVLAKKLEVTDEEVKKYMEEHPELGSKEEKRAKAEEILTRVKAGEDFAKLAEEFSEDPGSKDKGGLYEGINEGAFVPEFEKAVFSLQEGQIYPELVESNFGFHIIKLEKLGESEGADGQKKRTFDARHILISTMFKDPENPMGREMPVKDYVKAKLEKEKEEKILKEIVENNPVAVAEDFEVVVPPMPEQSQQPQLPPGVTVEEVEPGAEVDAPAKPAPKKENKPAAPKK